MTKTLSAKSRRILMTLVALVLVSFSLIALAPSASAAEVFNPSTFTHNDTLNTYSDRYKLTNANVGEYVHANSHSPDNTWRYGGYVQATDDAHRYRYSRLILGGQMPRNYLSIYADPGVNIKVKNSSGAVLINTSSTGVLDRNEVIYDKITSYTGGVFHLYQLKEYAASTNLAEFFVEVETTSTQPLHYNIWFGCPLFAESRTSMSVPTRTLNKPNTTSAAVSTTTRANAVPANSWIKSMYYTISFQSGAGNLSIMYDSVRVPSDPSRYQMILSGNRYNFALNNTYAYKAQGTYSHRFEYCRWNGSSSAGNSYSNSATCYVEYYYVFGRGDTPIYS